MNNYQLFNQLKPPAGGLENLRKRINKEREGNARYLFKARVRYLFKPWFITSMVSVSACIITLLLIFPFTQNITRPFTQREPSFTNLVAETWDVGLIQYGFQNIPNEKVAIYSESAGKWSKVKINKSGYYIVE